MSFSVICSLINISSFLLLYSDLTGIRGFSSLCHCRHSLSIYSKTHNTPNLYCQSKARLPPRIKSPHWFRYIRADVKTMVESAKMVK